MNWGRVMRTALLLRSGLIHPQCSALMLTILPPKTWQSSQKIQDLMSKGFWSIFCPIEVRGIRNLFLEGWKSIHLRLLVLWLRLSWNMSTWEGKFLRRHSKNFRLAAPTNRNKPGCLSYPRPKPMPWSILAFWTWSPWSFPPASLLSRSCSKQVRG